MRVLILGASGFIGSAVARTLASRATVLGTYWRHKPLRSAVPLVPLDLADSETVTALAHNFRPEIVVHLVAQAVVENAAAEHAAAWQTNVTGTRSVVTACRAVGAKLIFLSTDYVFDGTAGPYAENAAPNPINAYGRMKLAAEEIVQEGAQSYLIARTSLVYGWSAPHHHSNFAAMVIHQLRQGQLFTAYTDMIRTPIYRDDLANVLVQLIARQTEGLYHLSSSDALSMYEFALSLCQVFELDRSLLVAAASKAQGDIPRPSRCGLRTGKATRDFGLCFPTTYQGISRMKEEEQRYG